MKSKFGKGSMLTMKMGKDENSREIAGILTGKLREGSRIEAVHCSTIFIHIEQGAASVARVLEIVNQVGSRVFWGESCEIWISGHVDRHRQTSGLSDKHTERHSHFLLY